MINYRAQQIISVFNGEPERQTTFYRDLSSVSNTVDPRYRHLDFCYLEIPLISERKSDPCYHKEF